MPKGAKIRQFSSGATRDTDEGKHDFEGYVSPLVEFRFGEYMTKHRVQPDGSVRDGDNWQRGIPKDALAKSATRHFMDFRLAHDGFEPNEELEEALCALRFNIDAYLFEVLKDRGYRAHGSSD